ncbi:TetR/AcrR family transcriptional regulator [Nonomuraea lactucae]|uniref:TetR/AcrR family transcriptional regulator n=1 Tax=Nonomuraea lactucae TaxID=2249762 RepID=UPI000DE54EBD|nr:TetR/AcrR family transcriptional regulator [Nonomuraea lactucae]
MGTTSTSLSPRRPRGRPRKMAAPEAVTTALRLVDEEGLDALTMRRLAAALDVQVGTLYRHFATKQALLAAMAEEMLADCADPLSDGTTWQEQVTELAGRLRTALLRHRDGARVYAGTHSIGPNTLSYADTLVGVLRGAGQSTEAATRTALAIIHFTLGHTLEEQAAGALTDSDLSAAVTTLHAALDPRHYPNLAAAEATLTSTDFAGHFAHGLNLLVIGLTATR